LRISKIQILLIMFYRWIINNRLKEVKPSVVLRFKVRPFCRTIWFLYLWILALFIVLFGILYPIFHRFISIEQFIISGHFWLWIPLIWTFSLCTADERCCVSKIFLDCCQSKSYEDLAKMLFFLGYHFNIVPIRP
jgi:cytochrome c biogenesis factor